MTSPYDEGWVIRTYYRLINVFHEAGLPVDHGRATIYTARATYDATTHLSYEAAADKHASVLRSELMPSPQPPPQPPLITKLESRDGRLFQGTQPFVWRGVSAFKLAKLMVDYPAKARELLAWASHGRVNVLRVFSMCEHLFHLEPQEGLDVLPSLLQEAATQGLYVEVVGLVDTKTYPFLNHQDHLWKLCEMQLRHPNMLLEVANEPQHPTQLPALAESMYLAGLVGHYPRLFLIALGAPLDTDDENDAYARAGGSYFTIHGDRRDGDAGWRWVRHTKEIWDMREQLPPPRRFACNDEPKRDDLRADRHFAVGALCRILGIGDTFHYGAGRFAEPPTHDELAAFEARQKGWDAIPLDWDGRFYNAGWAGSPIHTAVGSLRSYSSVRGSEAWTIRLDDSWPAELNSGWHIQSGRRIGKAQLLYLTNI